MVVRGPADTAAMGPLAKEVDVKMATCTLRVGGTGGVEVTLAVTLTEQTVPAP